MNLMFKKKEEEELKEAEQQIRRAYEQCKGYEHYIKLLPRRKNIGTERTPYYVQVDVPYMTVDGRIAMLIDEHMNAKQKYTIHPAEFFIAPDSKTLLCRVTVETMRGTAAGTAKVGINGTGVDATNPYENAETSALGRALGFLGYGLLGSGIASYEEVKSAIESEAKAVVSHYPASAAESHSEGEGAASPELSSDEPVKAKEMLELKKFLQERLGEEKTKEILPKVKTKSDLEAVKREYQ